MTSSQMRAPFSATAVASWFVDRVAADSEQDLSNLKLQKLLYLAQSLYLSRFQVSLVEEPFQAWENGPAVKAVYGQFKDFGAAPIILHKNVLATRNWPEPVEQTLMDIWTCFGGYSAWKLRDITHQAGPWKEHWRPGLRNIEIPNTEIRDAWPDFVKYAETPLVARTNNTSAALSRYAAVLADSKTRKRSGDMAGLEAESLETETLRRRASSTLS